jgi:hypothetical protein
LFTIIDFVRSFFLNPPPKSQLHFDDVRRSIANRLGVAHNFVTKVKESVQEILVRSDLVSRRKYDRNVFLLCDPPAQRFADLPGLLKAYADLQNSGS